MTKEEKNENINDKNNYESLSIEKIKNTIMEKSDSELISLIKEEFEQRGSIKQSKYKHNLILLGELDIDIVNIGITRMIRAEKVYESQKHMGLLLTLIIAAYSYFDKGLNGIGNLTPSFLVGFSLLFIFVYITHTLTKARDRMLTCLYFKKLLEYEKENRK